MKKIEILGIIFILLFSVSGCNHGPKPIEYGSDACHYCSMTIVDKIHGAEIITDKGKVFKFDASECMVNYLEANKEVQLGQMLTNYFEAPTEFMPTQEATFLISENLPSPMGANLTAFKTKVSAEKFQFEKGGNLYTWEELKSHLGN